MTPGSGVFALGNALIDLLAVGTTVEFADAQKIKLGD
ncbi:hypothetical protein NAEX_02864 [Nannocystis exedens]|nr:hypothetical protein NAEX_02864 [Nannocystis exedens]